MRPGDPDGVNLLASWYLAKPQAAGAAAHGIPQPAGGGDRNAIPLYDLPRQRITNHLITEMPLRVSALRTLGAYANVFAIESFMDELAAAAQRRSGRVPPRASQGSARQGGDRGGRQGGRLEAGREGRRHARARHRASRKYKNLATYVAVVAEVEVDRDSGQVKVPRACAAVDSGQIINPDGLTNQIEGGIIQSTSWTLHEEVRFDKTGILSRDWDELSDPDHAGGAQGRRPC